MYCGKNTLYSATNYPICTKCNSKQNLLNSIEKKNYIKSITKQHFFEENRFFIYLFYSILLCITYRISNKVLCVPNDLFRIFVHTLHREYSNEPKPNKYKFMMKKKLAKANESLYDSFFLY